MVVTNVVGMAKKRENDAIAARDGGAEIKSLIDLVGVVELVEDVKAGVLDLVEEKIVKVTLREATHV